MRRFALISSLVIALVSPANAQIASPCCTTSASSTQMQSVHSDRLSVTGTQVENCTRTALAANHMTATAAQHLLVGDTAEVLGARVTFASGDTIWGSCSSRLRLVAISQENERQMREVANLEMRLIELESRYLQLRERMPHRTGLQAVLSWISSALPFILG